jgi:hypothetical protein
MSTSYPAFVTEGAQEIEAFLGEVEANHEANLPRWMKTGAWLIRVQEKYPGTWKEILAERAPRLAEMEGRRRTAIVWLAKSARKHVDERSRKEYRGWEVMEITPDLPWEMRRDWAGQVGLRLRKRVRRPDQGLAARAVRHRIRQLDQPADHPLAKLAIELAKAWTKGWATDDALFAITGEPPGYVRDDADDADDADELPTTEP